MNLNLFILRSSTQKVTTKISLDILGVKKLVFHASLSVHFTFMPLVIMTAQSRFSKIVNKIMAVTLHRIHLRKSQTLSSPTGWNWLWCEIRNRTNVLTYRRSTVVVTVVIVVGRPGSKKKKCANSHDHDDVDRPC